MRTWCGVLAVCLLAAVAHGMGFSQDLYNDPASDMLLQELQKRLEDMNANSYLYDDAYPWYGDLSAEIRDGSLREDIREPEVLSHGSQSQGFQYISGGAGEGKQELKPEGNIANEQVVKSDEGLPFYCHPPNPCPKGYSAAENCHDFIQDTVEEQRVWISKMMEKGLCSCDREHMFSCPQPEAGEAGRPAQGGGENTNDVIEQQNAMDSFMAYMDQNQVDGKFPWSDGEKLSVVAKKSPIVKRSAAVNEDAIEAELDRMKKSGDFKHNPYLIGAKVSTYAKKG